MALWQKLWLLFTVIWVVVSGLQAATILAFAEGVDREKALTPIVLGIAVPAAVYVLAWVWVKLRSKR
jgi:hypothetical protein